MLSVRLVAHDLGQPQCAGRVADPLDAPAHCARGLAGRELAILREQLNDRECYRISEQPAQTRLSVALLLHATYVPCFRNSENVEVTLVNGGDQLNDLIAEVSEIKNDPVAPARVESENIEPNVEL
jgi:hypothetical protein